MTMVVLVISIKYGLFVLVFAKITNNADQHRFGGTGRLRKIS
jgi:hypothetical protein